MNWRDTKRWKDLLCLLIIKINIVKNGHSTKNNVQIQYKLHKIFKTIIHRNLKNNLKFSIESHIQENKTKLKQK